MVEQPANRVEREPEIAASLDESQAANIGPISGLGAIGGRQQPDPFVLADRFRFAADLSGQLADGQSHCHGLTL